MGNNKGRSKGCITCVRRRVKCDEIHPLCNRCITGKFLCLGYRDTLFIDGKDQVLRRLSRTTPSQLNIANTPLDSVETSRTACHSPKQFIELHNVSHYDQYFHIRPPLNNQRMRDDQYMSYLVANLHGPMETICRDIATKPCETNSIQTRVKRHCFLALATSFYAIERKQQYFLHQGTKTYYEAIRLLNTTMSICDNSGRLELLSAVYALCLHEAIAPTHNNEHTWLRHVDGFEQLLAMQERTLNMRDPAVDVLLVEFRPIMITAALHGRRPSLMARPEWSAESVCISNGNSQFSLTVTLAGLWDLLAQVPALYHDHDRLVSKTTERSSLQHLNGSDFLNKSSLYILLTRSLALRDLINYQIDACELYELGFVVPGMNDTINPSSQPYNHSTHYEFSSLLAADTFILYNALKILINQFIVTLCSLSSDGTVSDSTQETASECVSIAIADVVKSIDYYMTSSESYSGVAADTHGTHKSPVLLSTRIAHTAISRSGLPEDVIKRSRLEQILSLMRSRTKTWMSNDQIFDIRRLK